MDKIIYNLPIIYDLQEEIAKYFTCDLCNRVAFLSYKNNCNFCYECRYHPRVLSLQEFTKYKIDNYRGECLPNKIRLAYNLSNKKLRYDLVINRNYSGIQDFCKKLGANNLYTAFYKIHIASKRGENCDALVNTLLALVISNSVETYMETFIKIENCELKKGFTRTEEHARIREENSEKFYQLCKSANQKRYRESMLRLFTAMGLFGTNVQ